MKYEYFLPFYLRRWFINTLFVVFSTMAVVSITLIAHNYCVCKRLGEIAAKVNVDNTKGLEEIRAYSPRLMIPKTKARHSLLHSCLLYKSGQRISSDSIIAPAVKYYSKGGAARERAHMHFYYGNILMNQQEYAEAYNQILISSLIIPQEDVYLLGQVSYFLGHAFMYSWNFVLAEKYLCQSIESFEKIEHKANTAMAYDEYASLCAQTERYGEAANAAKKVEEYYTSVGNMEKAWDLRIYYHYNLANHTGEYREAVAEMEKVLDEWGWENATYDACRFYFRICTLARERGKARKMLPYLERFPSWNDTAGVMHQDSYMSRLNYVEGNYKEAYNLLSKAWDTSARSRYQQDKNFGLMGSFFNCYTRELKKANSNLYRLGNILSVLMICLLIAVVGGGVALGLAQRRRKNLVLSSEEIAHLRESLRGLLDSSKTNYESLTALVVALSGNQNRPDKMIELLRTYISQDNHYVRYFYEKVNDKNNHFFKELGKRYPELSEVDLWLCAFIIEDFTASTISFIFSYSNFHSVYNRNTRIRKILGIPNGIATKTYLQDAIDRYTESCSSNQVDAQAPLQG